MFDFSKINMIPNNRAGFKRPATKEQIDELESFCGHSMPENLKFILIHFNGSSPEATYFDSINILTGVPCERELVQFYHLDSDKDAPSNIWWAIDHYGKFMGKNTLPFACNDDRQNYFLKWVDGVAQVWLLNYDNAHHPETYFVVDSIDVLLESLYYLEE